MERRIVDGEITLVPYDPNYKASLPWYQDADVCKQVDNRNSVYDLKLLKAMYRYLNARGSLFYIKYRGRRRLPASGRRDQHRRGEELPE